MQVCVDSIHGDLPALDWRPIIGPGASDWRVTIRSGATQHSCRAADNSPEYSFAGSCCADVPDSAAVDFQLWDSDVIGGDQFCCGATIAAGVADGAHTLALSGGAHRFLDVRVRHAPLTWIAVTPPLLVNAAASVAQGSALRKHHVDNHATSWNDEARRQKRRKGSKAGKHGR